MSVNVNQPVDWTRSNLDLAKDFRVSPVTVWRYKRKIGIPSSGRRGRPAVDRSEWDWSLRDVDLAKLYRISRQRVGVLRRRQRQIQRKLRAQNGKRDEREDGQTGATIEASETGGSQEATCSQDNRDTGLEVGESFFKNEQSSDPMDVT